MTIKNKVRISLVDDDPVQHFILERLIPTLNHPCTVELQSFPSAREFLKSDTLSLPLYDIIIVDINMPVMTGFELLEKIDPSIDGSPVFILSSSHSEEDKTRALGFSSVKDFVTKPLDEIKLETIIRKAFN